MIAGEPYDINGHPVEYEVMMRLLDRFESETGGEACVLNEEDEYAYAPEFLAWVAEELHLVSEEPPEIKDMMPRVINVYFIKEHRQFFNKHNKKSPNDYILNVDKLAEEKFGSVPCILNPIQMFTLNYEIRRALDKAVTIANAKYENIIYINSELNRDGMCNIMRHIGKIYRERQFQFVILDPEDAFRDACWPFPEDVIVVKAFFD